MVIFMSILAPMKNYLLKHPFLYNMLIVLATFFIYLLAKSGIIYPFSRRFIDVMIFACCVAQLSWFVIFSLQRLLVQAAGDYSYLRLLVRISATIGLVLLTFTMNYWCLHNNEPSSFTGISDTSHFRALLDMFYFSCVTFATVGYGDILPRSVAAKSCVILEMATAFFMVVYVLSNANNILQAVRGKKIHEEK